MTQGLARYHARSPRYILDTQDNELIRVAGPRQVPWEEGTEITNVSLTGLAFFAPEDLCPVLGEVIKIQFLVPGSKQMACFGIVTRLDPEPKDRILVGVHFYKLEMAHRIVLAQGLAKKLKSNSKFHMDLNEDPSNWVRKFMRVFIMSFMLSAWTMIMVSLLDQDFSNRIARLFRTISGLLS